MAAKAAGQSAGPYPVVQLHLDQPPDQELGRGEGGQAGYPHRGLPPIAWQPAGDGPQRHRRAGQVRRELLGPLALGMAEAGRVRLGTGARTVLAVPHPGQQVPHRVGAQGYMREDTGPRPSRQQRRCPQIRFGDDPGLVDQPLRGLVDLVAQLPLRAIHQLILPTGLVTGNAGRCDRPRLGGTAV
jgi:hypothetical protein